MYVLTYYRIENIFKNDFEEVCFDENNWEHFSSLLGKIIVKLVGVDKLSSENKLQPAVSERTKTITKFQLAVFCQSYLSFLRDMADFIVFF